jgi:hypothetical protein
VPTYDQPTLGWTVVLRRQPVRIVEGQPEGGYTDAYELICCECGDHPDLDYRDVSPELQRIRGPYTFADGIAAYGEHIRLRHRQQSMREAGQTRRSKRSTHARANLPGQTPARRKL